ncbi:trigger factor [Granulicella pectinivorans]|uniref:Trigger factor n=1 Tax=Granulicella pectinivorans TaxID=474950 RepID=A0A1I6MAI0_9BACT|nr:trigger factor [Granulicella pectinivorans]SFS12647.1 trigger factor [Granulicella pectinivorans]
MRQNQNIPLEGTALTPTETTEEKNLAEQTPSTELEHTHDHADHQGHDHEGHDHAGHNHGPSLNPALIKEISVEVPADEVSKAFKSVIKRYQKIARIPGFRIGKVPETVIKSRFMKEIRQEILETLVSDRFRQAIEAQDINPVSQPQITSMNLFDGQPLTFTAVFETLPTIDISGYDSVSVTRPDVTVTDEEYAAELDRALEPHATVETVDEDRALVDGDWAEIGFTGNIKPLAQVVGEEPAPTEPITGEDVLIEIGGKNTLAAFNDALRGTRAGQELEFEVSYPADFGEPRLANQTVSYDVQVKAIKKKTFPERDEEFAKQLGNYESFADFETKLREQVADRKKDALENRAKEVMLEELIGRFTFEVPETFVQQQVDARLDRGLRALAQQGMKAEDMRKLDFNRLREAQRDQAVNEVKASLILDRIADAEKVEVDQEEVDRELLIMSIQGREPLESLRERMQKDGAIDRMKEQMRREKTGTVLYEKLAS